MNLVKQEDSMGCGVACVASMLQIDYQEARDLFEKGKFKAKTIGFQCKEISILLKNKGLKFENKYIKNRHKNFKLKTIVFLRRSKKYPYGHYLLKTESGWMDPWRNFPSADRKAGFRKRLPEKPIYEIFEV